MPSISTYADVSAGHAPSGPDGFLPREGPQRDEASERPWRPAGWDAVPLPPPPYDPPLALPAGPTRHTRPQHANASSPYSFTAVLASLAALTTVATAMVVMAGSARLSGAAVSHTTPFLADRPEGPAVVADPPVTGSGAGPSIDVRPTRPRQPDPPASPKADRRARPETDVPPPSATEPPAERPPEVSPAPPRRQPPARPDLRRRLVDLCAVSPLLRCVSHRDTGAKVRHPATSARSRHQPRMRPPDRNDRLRQHRQPGVPVTRNARFEVRQCGPAAHTLWRHCMRHQPAEKDYAMSR